MKYPCLIMKSMCKTDIHIEISQEGLNEYGEPLEPVVIDTKCNYQDSAKTILTAEKKLVELSGCAFIPEDITPSIPVISGGIVIVNDIERRIYQGIKSRNPDGTVNYTELRLI